MSARSEFAELRWNQKSSENHSSHDSPNRTRAETQNRPRFRGMAHLFRYLPIFILLIFLPHSAFNQASSPMIGPDPSYTSPNASSTSSEGLAPPRYDAADEQRRTQLVIAERHDAMVSDTNKLLKLAQELNVEIGRTNPESLTPSQLGKVAEIQKLAHRVKSKMADSFRDTSRLSH